MPATMTGRGFAVPAELNKNSTAKPLPRWQTADLHPECYNPRRKNRAIQATDAFYKVLGILWLMTVVVFYLYMVTVAR